MAKYKLTERFVEKAVCPPGRKDALFFDRDTRGFALRVTASGNKYFLAQYPLAGGKRREPLGAFGVLTPEQARMRAKMVLGAAAQGADPFADRKAREAAARLAVVEVEYTFGRMVDAWALAREGDRRPTYLHEAVRCLQRNLPDWQDRAADSITLAEAVQALDRIKEDKSTVAANRTLAYARAAYGWAVKRQRLAANPMRGIERPGREAPRERVLSMPELGMIWRACDALSPALAGFTRVLMLTLGRRAEIASMRWAELDNPTAPTVWALPGARSKNARPHIVHLSKPVRAVIGGLPKVSGNPFVFAGKAGKPIAAFNFVKAEIVATLAEQGVTLPNWRLHDFRRAGVTELANTGYPPHVADRLLNHVTGTISGVAAVYQRAEFLPERKAALDAWAAHVLAVVDDRVVQLARAS